MNEEQKRDRRIENCLTHHGALEAKTELVDNVFIETCQLGSAGEGCKYQDRLEVLGYDKPSILYLCMFEVMHYENGGIKENE